MSDTVEEPDRAPGAPHPRQTLALFGHDAAQAQFAQAWASGRLHHAWLLRGPRGVGKATLAYRIARAVLSDPAPRADLDVAADTPVARRIAAGSEPRLKMIRREADPKTGKAPTILTVGKVRELNAFFGMAAPDDGWRVAVVDAADEMQAAAANALLKNLEEPPRRALLLLVAHAPGRLLPTIRSRCRTLDLAPLAPDDLGAALAGAGLASGGDAVALAALADGSPGAAMRLAQDDGVALYRRLAGLLAAAPSPDRAALAALADAVTGRDAQARYALTLDLTALLLTRAARLALHAHPPEPTLGEDALARRLAPGPAGARAWAAAAAEAARRAARSRAVNLDPAATILDIWRAVDAAAAQGFAPAR